MKIYNKFSYYYDDIMYTIDYKKMLEFTLQHLKPDNKILDLGCGSGSFLTLLKLKDFNVEGLDISESMIQVAKEKSKINRLNIIYHIGDMTNFNLDKKYDVITCFFDSINMLDSIAKVNKVFQMVSNHLNDGGLFIFDFISHSKYLISNKIKIKEDFGHFKYKWTTKTFKPNILKHIINIKDDVKIKEIYNQYYYDYKDFILNDFDIVSLTTDYENSFNELSDVNVLALKKRSVS